MFFFVIFCANFDALEVLQQLYWIRSDPSDTDFHSHSHPVPTAFCTISTLLALRVIHILYLASCVSCVTFFLNYDDEENFKSNSKTAFYANGIMGNPRNDFHMAPFTH